MNSETEAAFRQHAVAEYPRECCGLIAVIKGKERYLPCRNIADNPNANFALHPEDYARAEDLGEVIALAHSHPDEGTVASHADRVQCAASGIPWFIVSVNQQGDTSDIARYEPEEYEAPLVGRQFAHGILDCYSLIKDYYARKLNIMLPHFERRDNWWNLGDDLYMRHFREAGFEPIKGAVNVHDVIIMQVRAPQPNHAGVYIGDMQMLHHMYNRLSSRDIYGGYFQEVTRIIVRHRELSNG
jgi:proteasome lid subunit RPN8/RPN11